MKTSTSRMLTTHTGNLPRPAELQDLVTAMGRKQRVDLTRFDEATRQSVKDVVRLQAESGVDIVNDGEHSKTSYSTYVRERLFGFEAGEFETRPVSGDERVFRSWAGDRGPGQRAVVTEELKWKDFSAVQKDIRNLQEAVKESSAEEAFMTAVSPGTFCNHNGNRHYPTREAYLSAAADVMKPEYEAVVAAGFILQLDCPDLAASRDTFYADMTDQEFCKLAAEHIEALNYATRDIAPDRMRIHVCWGAGGGPHKHDIELQNIVDMLMAARPHGLSIVAANGRHEHEWSVWQDVKVPDGKVIIPGVIDSTATIIEHPNTVADRIVRFASVLGRENVIAGVDCGFRAERVDPQVIWEKLHSLSEGAAIASKSLGFGG